MADIPVVLVHGFASSFERNWRERGWVALLHEEVRPVIGVDLLGHGQAAKPSEPAAYAALEVSIVAALPAAGQVYAIGFNLGAHLLLRVASGSPARFRRIVLAGVGYNAFASSDAYPVPRAVDTHQAADAAAPSAA